MATARWLAVLLLVTPLAVLPTAGGLDPMTVKNATFIILALACVLWMIRSWWLRAFLDRKSVV